MKRLPWAIFAAAALLSATGMLLLARVPAEVLELEDNSFVLSATFATIPLVFGLVGAVVASRLPANRIGWLFLALALFDSLYELTYGYASYSVGVEDLPGAAWAAWVANWASPLAPPVIVATLVLFPDGRPPTPRWGWVAWAGVPVAVVALLQYGLAPGPTEFPELSNPVGLEGAPWLRDVDAEPLYTPLFLGGAVALLVRFRRSHGIERQQIKWFAYAASLVAAYLIVGTVATQIFGGEDSVALGFLFALCFVTVPVAAGIAILRHRLYDIDLVIRRTLVYGALTLTLAAAYLGTVLLVGLAVGQSDVTIAGATLAVAGLFGPARARIQAVVDRRFYRRRYDAAVTLEAFGAGLRAEVDLDALGSDLGAVVRETLQPAHVSLWLRSER